ncbi:MAG: GAF domain-containing protein [Candidatus Atribacteria bacterium]|nr:GAF domain-containing protein [Candidatus Atribacteria bacterium]
MSGSLLLKGEKGLVLVAGKNLHYSHFGERSQRMRGVSEVVFESGQPLCIDNTNPLFPSPKRKREDRYSLSFPVRDVNARVIGVLNLNRVDAPFTSEDIAVAEKLASAIALLVEENILRRNREKLLLVFSEIVNLFEGKDYLAEEKLVFAKIFAAVRMFLGIEQGAVFKLSPRRPYLAFRENWPRYLNFNDLGLKSETIPSERARVLDISWKGRERKLLLLPIVSDLGWRFLFTAFLNRDLEILEHLVLSMIAQLGKSCLDNVLLFRRNERLVQERERNELARELHDGLAQILASSQLYLHFLKNNTPQHDGDLWQEILDKLDYLTRMGIEESRFILSELAGKPVSALRLKSDLDSIINVFSYPGITIHREVTMGVRSVSFRIYRVITSVVREALSNVIRHSQAKNVWITLYDDAQFLYLSIKDDGKGLERGVSMQQAESGHFGIYNMRNRVKLARGRLRLVSSPKKGVTIEAKIPLE